MFKFYSLTPAAFASEIQGAKMPLQQKQIYAALVKLGKPSRGCDVVAQAVADGLVTRQAYDVLAAWYFSPKRRPACVTVSSEATAPAPTGPSTPVFAE
jgi:hypothetical protein